MAKNNFKRLEDTYLPPRSEEQIQRVSQNVDTSVSFIQMVGKIVEVYLPRFFDVFVLLGGGKTEQERFNTPSNFTEQPPSLGGDSDTTGRYNRPSIPK